MNFLRWYYSEGVGRFFAIWKNFFSFIEYFFSVKRLFLTLFSPWKRDVLADDWVGFHPVLWLQGFLIGTIFRFYGACARSIFIMIGLLMQFLFIFLGIILFLVWIFSPVIAILSIISFFWEAKIFLMVLLFLIIFDLVIFWGYIKSKRKDYYKMSLEELARQKWFQRVTDRSNLNPEVIDNLDWTNTENLEQILSKQNLSLGEFDQIINWEISTQREQENKRKFWSRENLFSVKPIGLYWSYGYTRYLDKYAIEITKHDYSNYGSVELFGYENTIELAELAFARNNQNNILLYGDPGVGKKSIVHNLAKKIRTGKSNRFLQDKRVFLINIGDVVSSFVDQGGNLEQAMHSIFKEAALAGDIILAVDQIGRYLGTAEKNSSINMSAIVSEYLRLPSFRMIATISRGSYQRLTKEGEAILKNFEISEVKEPKEQDVYRILIQKLKKEEKREIIFTFQALREVYRQSVYIGANSPLPERAIDLMTEVLLNSSKNGVSKITPQEVSDFITLKTGIKHGRIDEQEQENLLNLENILHQRVIGQEQAIDKIADSIRKMRAGIGDKKKPVGSFLFMGPTGVGKTETAKALAETYFGSDDNMIRIDMSEFQSPDSVKKMIGQVELQKSGLLTAKVEQNPFSLILLDEIEKAYPDILNLFLQVLDEGFLTDAYGKKINFSNTIIIATSNAGAELIKKRLDENFSDDEIKKQLYDYVIENNIFRVEFLNRFDDVIFFKTLTEEQLKKVINLMLNNFSKKIETEKNIKLDYETGVVEKIIKNGYDKIFGARSIDRYIVDNIQNIIAEKIISQEIINGSEIIIRVTDLN